MSDENLEIEECLICKEINKISLFFRKSKICKKCKAEFEHNKKEKEGLCGKCAFIGDEKLFLSGLRNTCRKCGGMEIHIPPKGMLYCTGCEVNHLIENFEFRKDNQKYRGQCIEYIKIMRKIYFEDNEEKIHAKQKEKREKNKSKSKIEKHEYYIKNQERLKQKAKQYRIDNPEKIQAYIDVNKLKPKTKKDRKKNTKKIKIYINIKKKKQKKKKKK